MAEVFNFIPKKDIKSSENLTVFIQRCKTELTAFGEDLDWDDWNWPGVCSFTKLGTNPRSMRSSDQLDQELIQFAKSYVRYLHGHNPTKYKTEMSALRVIEKSLLESGIVPCISNISTATLDNAAQIARDYFAVGTAYTCGRHLEKLARFLTIKNLVSVDISGWKTPLRKPNDAARTGEKARLRRERRLPSEEALDALAEIFSNSPSDPKDIFTSSTFAMLMCAPSRISEVLEMPSDCEVEQTDSKGVVRYGWRFYSGKGFGPNIKWIPTEMVGVAKEAVSRVKELTFEAREIAKWTEKNPHKFYRHNGCPKVPEHAFLSMAQVAQALSASNLSRRQSKSVLNNFGLRPVDGVHTLSSLWQYVLSRKPNGFPWLSEDKGIKYSDALFCMQRHLLHNRITTSPVLTWKPNSGAFNFDLSPRGGVPNHQSIFDRYGYKTKDNGRIKLTSHQARHFLNTVAQRGGLSQLKIAKWSGRAEANQNRTYNHMSEYEMVAMAEKVDINSTLYGPSGEIAKLPPISTQELNTLEKGALHITEFGVCVHDFTMSPCDKFRDCINCTEQVCLVGDEDKLLRLKARFEYVEEQYLSAKKAIQENMAGADRWYEYHEKTWRRLTQLIDILEDPSLPKGTQVKLQNDGAFTSLGRAMNSRTIEPLQLNMESGGLESDPPNLLENSSVKTPNS